MCLARYWFVACLCSLGTQAQHLPAVPSVELSVSNKGFVDWITSILGSYYGEEEPEPEVTTLPPPVSADTCEPCTCGLLNKKTRIVGGQMTYVNQYPWMILLKYRGKFYCGATLITAKYVLTAAHCVHGLSYKRISVRVFEHDLSTENETTHIDRKVKRIVKHRGFSGKTINNDIALLELDEPVKFEGDLRPVCLPPGRKTFTGQTGVVTGWGVTSVTGSTSPVLREVAVPIMSNTECRKTAYGRRRITDNMMCAGYPEGKKDSCQGDSGGPLHVANDSVHHIAGVVSWGDGCAEAGYPGVYTRVNRYLTWIKSNTQDSCYCNLPPSISVSPLTM